MHEVGECAGISAASVSGAGVGVDAVDLVGVDAFGTGPHALAAFLQGPADGLLRDGAEYTSAVPTKSMPASTVLGVFNDRRIR
ncbi:hypothetical protein [Streptomyces radiopugnans]|uniref:hypothetical protein n=1 Tax=Streptomyces radiopugnans TaxID=403935 RepID=UPI003F19A808